MNFTSLAFLLFFPLVLCLHRLLPLRLRPAALLLFSWFFYWYWNPWTFFLLLGATVVSYLAARRIADGEIKYRRFRMAVTVVLLLGGLFVFKYLGFAVWNLSGLFRSERVMLQILLPAGISFYTFQTLSYVIDVYHGRMKPERSFLYYALFVSFFPQLVAGPIERPESLLPELHALAERRQEGSSFEYLMQMAGGFFRKIVIADALAGFVDRVYAAPEKAAGPAAVLATVCFAVQIYCDFSGYSEIALGAAGLLGVKLTRNFRRPYAAADLRDFWHRWHITLTGWFTDYVYKPLGGSRKGLAAECRNILIVFCLSGFWHGAAWHYAVWGLIHGFGFIGYTLICSRREAGPAAENAGRRRFPQLAAETAGDRRLPQRNAETGIGSRKLPLPAARALTFAFVCFAWIFFRAESVRDALLMISRLPSGWNPVGFQSLLENLQSAGTGTLHLILVLAALPLLERLEERGPRLRLAADGSVRWEGYLILFEMLLVTAAAWSLQLAGSVTNAFLYFQF